MNYDNFYFHIFLGIQESLTNFIVLRLMEWHDFFNVGWLVDYRHKVNFPHVRHVSMREMPSAEVFVRDPSP